MRFDYPLPPLLSLRISADGLLALSPSQLETATRASWKAPTPSATFMAGPVFTF